MSRAVSLAILVTSMCGLIGCSQTSKTVQSLVSRTDSTVRGATTEPIVRILGLWEPATGVGPNGKPARGFVGQVLFFTPGAAAPAVVDGTIDIYTFDDTGTPDEQARPIKKFEFDTEAWNAHYVDGVVGPSYNVRIPYVKDHPHETVCALRIKYTSPTGQVSYSDMDSVTLPGSENPNNLFARKTKTSASAHELMSEKLGLESVATKSKVEVATETVVDGTAIMETQKSSEGLRTLSIRQNNPRQRRTKRWDRPNVADGVTNRRAKSRFKLSNADNPKAGAAGADLSGDDFAPLSD